MSRALVVLDSEFQRRKAADWCWSLKPGTRVEFKAPQRSSDQNAKMWAMLTEVATQARHHTIKLTPDDWKLLFLDALKREVRMVPNLEGNGIVSLGRSSSDLSKEEMSDLIELIFKFGAEKGVKFAEGPQEAPQTREGFDRAHVARETATLSGEAMEQTSSAPPPADDEGSGVQSARSDAAADPSGDEPVKEEGEADPATAAPSSDEITAANLRRALMEECVDNMLRDAFGEPADQQRQKVERLRDVFLMPVNLGAHPDFVNRCAETVLRILGKPAEKARAREYLVGKIL